LPSRSLLPAHRSSTPGDAAQTGAVLIQRGDCEWLRPLGTHHPYAEVRLQRPPVLLAILDDGDLLHARDYPASHDGRHLARLRLRIGARPAADNRRTQVNTSGQLLLSNGSYPVFFAPVGLIFFAAWLLAVAYQIVRWRRSASESRQQLSWLMAGARWPWSRLSPASSSRLIMASGRRSAPFS
jgi:hypothetical protein